LGDTVFRVGCDLKRKLHRNDRVLSPLIDGLQSGSPFDMILLTFKYGTNFRGRDEGGNMFPGDIEFSELLDKKGLGYVLSNICGLDPVADKKAVDLILNQG
jgi:mannitol-1-phosphate 5-dehydrogenase